MKTDWRRARDKKNNLCQVFFLTDKRKNNKKGFKNPSYKNKERKHYSEKNFSKKIGKKKKTFIRQKRREEIFPCFWKRVLDSEKTQQENKREKKEQKNEGHEKKTQKTPKKEKTKKKINLKQSSFIFKKLQKSKKRQKHFHLERENSEKKKEKHGKHTEIMKKDGKSRNKEEIFFRE